MAKLRAKKNKKTTKDSGFCDTLVGSYEFCKRKEREQALVLRALERAQKRLKE